MFGLATISMAERPQHGHATSEAMVGVDRVAIAVLVGASLAIVDRVLLYFVGMISTSDAPESERESLRFSEGSRLLRDRCLNTTCSRRLGRPDEWSR